jgi:hypothetical protein
MSCAQVQHAVCWPLDAAATLEGIYCSLLKMLLTQWQVSCLVTSVVVLHAAGAQFVLCHH